jgi:hypothetical protein
LYRYFVDLKMPNIAFPDKRFFTTNDPVMTPELLDYFFNQRTQVFARLDDDEKRLLHSIYDLPAYKAVLPELPPDKDAGPTRMRRRHRRFSVICPATLQLGTGVQAQSYQLEVVECWMAGFRARAQTALPIDVPCTAQIELGHADHSQLAVRVLRKAHANSNTFVLQVDEPDLAWRKFVHALRKAATYGDLDNATRYLE